MPEGDTIFRAARTLNRALAGHVVTRFESVFPHLTRVHEDTPITGRTVDRVDARGKHLLMHFSGDLILRTHMRMSGSWHIYRPGERWLSPSGDMRVIVGTESFVAVAFKVPVAVFETERTIERNESLGSLGPDLLADDFSTPRRAQAPARARSRKSSRSTKSCSTSASWPASATSSNRKRCSRPASIRSSWCAS